MNKQEFSRIFSIPVEPVPGLAETKTVPPGIHVGHDSRTPGTLDVAGKQYLQVAHGGLFKIVAAGVSIETIATLTVHTDDVASLVKEGMHWRVATNIYCAAHNASLGITPEAARYFFISSLND